MRKKAPEAGRHRRQRGSTMVETVMALGILLLAFFGLIQIYHWAIARLFCEYSAFYAAKGVALGYNYNLALRSARVAAIGISGPDRSAGGDSDDEYERISTYLTRGDASGVWYEYWAGNTDDEPALRLYGPTPGEEACGTGWRGYAPRLAPNFARLLGITENPEPAATVTTYNYSSIYME